MNELDGNIPTDDMSNPPVRTDLLIKNHIVNVDKYPDAKLHKHISFLKSFVRIVGCTFGGFGMFIPAFVSFGIAEVIGIVEEMV